MKMKRKSTIWVGVSFGIIILSCAAILSNPFRGSEQHIHDWLLKRAPLGSSIEDVKSMISKNGWKLDYDWKGTPSAVSEKQYPGVQGEHIIGVLHLDHHHGFPIPLNVDIDVYWGFDSQDRLIDLNVRKMTDSL
jgi:hypothetical protein